MTQQELERQVARATGESLCEIRHRGFSIADPLAVCFDPEPGDPQDKYLDWDAMQRVDLPRRYHPRQAVAA
jgi:hypothetical protein